MAQDETYRGDPGYRSPPVFGPPPGYGYAPPPGYGYRRPTNTLAVLSLVLALPVAPAGIVLGVLARKQIRRTGEDGDGLAVAGIVLGSVVITLWVLLIVMWLALFASITSGSFGP